MPKQIKNKSIITKDQIMYNAPRELKVLGFGVIKVKDPTDKDRKIAEARAMDHPSWNKMGAIERGREISRQLALTMLVEPKLTEEDIENANDLTLSNIIGVITMDYTLRVKKLTDKRSREIKSFLDQMKEE